MKGRRKPKLTLKDVVRDIFKYRDIEFKDFEFFYWRDFEGFGNPEPVFIKDLSNGLLDGEYSLEADVAQISNIDEVPFKILDFFVVATFKGNRWIGITFDSTSFNEEYSPHPGQNRKEYFKNRRTIIIENIKEALEILSLFFNRYN